MYSKTTNDIMVTVEPTYLEAQSSPAENQYLWAYQIRIENRSDRTVQLKTRAWDITDARGATQQVRGAGVVGDQPVLEPGDWYEYVSGTPLTTPSGMMRGSYGMVRDDGSSFDVEVPAFSLDSPYERPLVN